ncbi:MAG: SpoIIAA family protein [Paracoccaceae bacterium]
MIEISQSNDSNILEVSLSGELTGPEYDKTILPAIEALLAVHDHVRVLLIATDEFSGFDLGGAWADTKMGLKHWSGFDRIAIATNKDWIRNSARFMGGVMPCPVQVFSLAEVDEARRWLRESLGAVHIRDLGGPCLHVQALGTFDPEVIAHAKEDLSAMLREREGFRLLLDLREFNGWEGISALLAHLGFGREIAPMLDKIAIVADGGWQSALPKVISRFISAESQVFDEGDFDAAEAWLSKG